MFKIKSTVMRLEIVMLILLQYFLYSKELIVVVKVLEQ